MTSQQPNSKLIKEAAKNITKRSIANNNVNKSTLNHSKDKSAQTVTVAKINPTQQTMQ